MTSFSRVRTTQEEINMAIIRVASLENAQTWADTIDQFVYILDLLCLSLVGDGGDRCTRAVDKLEARFVRLLNEDADIQACKDADDDLLANAI